MKTQLAMITTGVMLAGCTITTEDALERAIVSPTEDGVVISFVQLGDNHREYLERLKVGTDAMASEVCASRSNQTAEYVDANVRTRIRSGIKYVSARFFYSCVS